MRDITHFLLATLLSLATLACRHDTPPADGSLSRQLPPDTKEILRQLNDRDNREEALRLADSLAALPPSDDPWLEIRIAQAVANTLYKFRRDPLDAIRVQERASPSIASTPMPPTIRPTCSLPSAIITAARECGKKRWKSYRKPWTGA